MRVNEELARFDPALARKPQVVALNKIDLPEVQARLKEIKSILSRAGIKPLYLAAATGQGVTELMAEAAKVLQKVSAGEKAERLPVKVFRPQPRDAAISVRKEGAGFVLSAPELERIVAGAGASPAELRWLLKSRLARPGVNKALQKAGIKPGDKIRCGNLEWEW
jgi:GTP-binding protein